MQRFTECIIVLNDWTLSFHDVWDEGDGASRLQGREFAVPGLDYEKRWLDCCFEWT
jgi:hypothetical protein